MEQDNTLLIIEESDNEQKTQEESPAVKLKLALANKKLKDDFFKENEINKTTEIINDDFENEIDESFLQMEQAVDLTYESESDDEKPAPSKGKFYKRHAKSSGSSDSDDDDGQISAKNSKLIESSVLQRKHYDDYHINSILTFFERRRLSECKEESESDVEVEVPEKPIIAITSTNAAPKKRFIVTKTEEPVVENPVKQPVSILKKTPSPPLNIKNPLTSSPKKIRYEATGLKDVSAQKNSQTIHFPCSSASVERPNVKSFFSPQGLLNPHLDKRYFDTSLVEVRASQTLTNSSKSLDGRGSRQLDDNVWIKRKDGESDDTSINVEKTKKEISSESVDDCKKVDGVVSLNSHASWILQTFN